MLAQQVAPAQGASTDPTDPKLLGTLWELGVLILAGGGCPPLPHARAWPSPGITSDSLWQRVRRALLQGQEPCPPQAPPPWLEDGGDAGELEPPPGTQLPSRPSPSHTRPKRAGPAHLPTASPAWCGKAALRGWPLSRCQLPQGSGCSLRTWETDLGAPPPPPVPGCELGGEGSKLKAAGKG